DDGGAVRTSGDGAAAPAFPSLRAAKPRGNRVAAALILGLAIGGGALFAWTRSSGDAPSVADLRAASTESAGAVRIAVLPFENLGDSTDAYFADGVTDAVRGKLAAISGLEVIARASSE